jgi:DNA-binding PadR family transcriptional regulator
MNEKDLSLLEFALLGLVHEHQPCCGYDLRKIFTETPMGRFSDSPGSIYPALTRLEKAGQIRGRVEEVSAVRRRRVFQLAASGRKSLVAWLRRPITEADMPRGIPELALRFAFLERSLGRAECLPFLEALAKELTAYIPVLRQHLEAQRTTNSLSASLAMESGVMSYECYLTWTRRAIRRFREARTRSISKHAPL